MSRESSIWLEQYIARVEASYQYAPYFHARLACNLSHPQSHQFAAQKANNIPWASHTHTGLYVLHDHPPDWMKGKGKATLQLLGRRN